MEDAEHRGRAGVPPSPSSRATGAVGRRQAGRRPRQAEWWTKSETRPPLWWVMASWTVRDGWRPAAHMASCHCVAPGTRSTSPIPISFGFSVHFRGSAPLLIADAVTPPLPPPIPIALGGSPLSRRRKQSVGRPARDARAAVASRSRGGSTASPPCTAGVDVILSRVCSRHPLLRMQPSFASASRTPAFGRCWR